MNIGNRITFVKLADIYYRVVVACLKESNKIENPQQRDILGIAAIFGYSFLLKAMSIRFISDGTPIEIPSYPRREQMELDWPSLDTLLRAEWEAFLSFDDVFFQPESYAEKEYKYLRYKIAGVIQVLKFESEVSNVEGKVILEWHKRTLRDLKQRIRQNSFIGQLKEKERKTAFRQIDDGINPPPRWRDKARRVGFSESLCDRVYSLLSASAHSEFLALGSSVPAEERDNARNLEGTFYILNILVANMIHELSSLFEVTKRIWQNDESIVNNWISRGRHDVTFSIGDD